jgi:hypothetical protein
VSLRRNPVERTASLPDGSECEVRCGVAEDGYIPRRLIDTVVLELRRAGEHLGALTTLLRPDQDREARELVGEVVRRLESGEVEPTHPGELERLPWVA